MCRPIVSTGTVTQVDAAAGTVTIGTAAVELTSKAAGGQATIDGVGITVGPKTRVLGRDGGAVRFTLSAHDYTQLTVEGAPVGATLTMQAGSAAQILPENSGGLNGIELRE